MRKILQLLPS